MNHQINQWRIKFTKACLAFVVVSLIYLGVLIAIHQPASAQSDLTLKSDIISLKARISRLEQEVSRLRGSDTNSRNPATPKQQSTPQQNRENFSINNERSVASSDPMFDRLATLLIELKEDVRNIKRRLVKIEKSL